MDTSLLSKAFKYQDHLASKGAIFHGGIFVDNDGLYLVHNKHAWESAGMAIQFGLLGILINWIITRKKTVEYPFQGIKYGDLDKQNGLNLKDAKNEALICIIPKASISAFSTSMLKGTKIKVGSITIVPIGGGKGKVLKQMRELGYQEAQ